MLTVEELRALVTTSVSDEDLEGVIEREEAWLARRIGPLEGERTETFVARDGDEVLRLTRPALSVAVADDGGPVSLFQYRRWSDVLPGDPSGSYSWRPGDVTVSYTPDDELEVKRVLITAVRLTLNESAYASEAAQGYSVSSDGLEQRTTRYGLPASLLRPRSPGTTRLRSTVPFGGRSLGPVAIAVAGS